MDIKFEELAGYTARQQEAVDTSWKHRFVLYGGARGGGKSRLLRWWLLQFALTQSIQERIEGLRVALFCETYPDLRDRQISKIRTEFPDWLGRIKETKEDGLCYFVNPEYGGAIIMLRNLDDPAKYMSAEYAACGVDELTKNLKSTFDILRGSLRFPGVPKTRFMGATNPGSIGHMWVKQLWIDRDFPPEMEHVKKEFAFVQSLPTDNPHLTQEYWDDLRSLDPELQRAWVYGDWEVFAGQAFPTYRHETHTCDPFPIPSNWVVWRSVDWGSTEPFCALWFALDPHVGRIYVTKEVYKADLTDHEQAVMIKQNTPEKEMFLTYADPSMWTKKTMGHTVSSTANEFMKRGVILTRANNDRLDGKRKIDRLLMQLPDGKPGLVFFNTCHNLIRTFPSLARHKTRVEDVDDKQEDHAYDALRYGLTNYEAHENAIRSNSTPHYIQANPWVNAGLPI